MYQIFILSLFALVLLCSSAEQGEYSDLWGPKRDGIYLETGLLKQWPEEGPDLLWSYDGSGHGHNSVAAANNSFYVCGLKDSAQAMGTLFADPTSTSGMEKP